eukprot:3312299-Rhodomonas_salina.1
MTGSRFYNLDRLRRDAIGLMDKHVSLMPSNGEQKGSSLLPMLKLDQVFGSESGDSDTDDLCAMVWALASLQTSLACRA